MGNTVKVHKWVEKLKLLRWVTGDVGESNFRVPGGSRLPGRSGTTTVNKRCGENDREMTVTQRTKAASVPEAAHCP